MGSLTRRGSNANQMGTNPEQLLCAKPRVRRYRCRWVEHSYRTNTKFSLSSFCPAPYCLQRGVVLSPGSLTSRNFYQLLYSLVYYSTTLLSPLPARLQALGSSSNVPFSIRTNQLSHPLGSATISSQSSFKPTLIFIWTIRATFSGSHIPLC